MTERQVVNQLEELQKLITDVFKCGICLCVLNEAVSCVEGHVFCKACLERWLTERQQERQSVTCPECRGRVSRPLPDLRVVNQFLTDAPVWCTLGDPQCTWRGSYNRLGDHTSVCPCRKVSCVSCQKDMEKRRIEDHMEVCPKHRKPCRLCQENIPREQMETHLMHACAEGTVPCPLHCGIVLARKDLLKHIGVACHKRWSMCPVSGCGAVLVEQNMKQHNIANMDNHRTLLMQAAFSQGNRSPRVSGPLFSFRWAVADPTRPVRSPTFKTSEGKEWVVVAVPPNMSVPAWYVTILLARGFAVAAKLRVKLSAGDETRMMTVTDVLVPGSGKKWKVDLQQRGNVTVDVVIQHSTF